MKDLDNHINESNGLTTIDLALIKYMVGDKVFEETSRQGAGKLKALIGIGATDKAAPEQYKTAGKKIAHMEKSQKRDYVGTINFLKSSAKIYNNIMQGYLEEYPEAAKQRKERSSAENKPADAAEVQKDWAEYKEKKKVKKEKLERMIKPARTEPEVKSIEDKDWAKNVKADIETQRNVEKKKQLLDYEKDKEKERDKKAKERTILAKQTKAETKQAEETAKKMEQPAKTKRSKPKEKRFVEPLTLPGMSKKTSKDLKKMAEAGMKFSVTPPAKGTTKKVKLKKGALGPKMKGLSADWKQYVNPFNP